VKECRLARFLKQKQRNNQNLHLIAISNLEDPEISLKRWWHKKHRHPQRSYGDYTYEELVIEQLEDFYEAHPQEIERMLANIGASSDDWDGTMSSQYEEQVKKRHGRFFEKNKVDLSKWKSDEALDEDDEKSLIENLGRSLPRSEFRKTLLDEEFEDDFGG